MTIRGTLVALSVIALASAALFPRAAHAQEPQLVGEFEAWAAYSYDSDNGKVCYIVAQPTESEPKNVNRDPVFFLVTHRPGQNVRNEVSTIIGYPFKQGSSVTVTIDDNPYEMFTSGDGGWFDSGTKDSQVVRAMKAGLKMSVKGVSWRGTETMDQYSLSGVTAAMNKIDETCN